MRTFIFALAALVPAFAIDQAGAADELPAFDIARNCNAETAGAITGGPASCTRDETEAKNQLAKRWSSFSASQKKGCVEESSIGGEKSYVELLTCLEMATGQFSTGRGQNNDAGPPHAQQLSLPELNAGASIVVRGPWRE